MKPSVAGSAGWQRAIASMSIQLAVAADIPLDLGPNCQRWLTIAPSSRRIRATRNTPTVCGRRRLSFTQVRTGRRKSRRAPLDKPRSLRTSLTPTRLIHAAPACLRNSSKVSGTSMRVDTCGRSRMPQQLMCPRRASWKRPASGTTSSSNSTPTSASARSHPSTGFAKARPSQYYGIGLKWEGPCPDKIFMKSGRAYVKRGLELARAPSPAQHPDVLSEPIAGHASTPVPPKRKQA
jgi:hypothetical protein